MSRNINHAVKRSRGAGALVAAACLSLPGMASAAPSTWAGASTMTPPTDNWSDGTNWSSGVPGSTTVSGNSDVATFPSVTNTTVTLDQSYNLEELAFTGGSYIINADSGASLELTTITTGSSILGIPSTGTAATQTINAPIIVEPSGAAGAATFNNGALTADGLILSGAISGAATSSATTTTLTFNGAGSGTASGVISDNDAGAGANVTSVVVGGNGGNWTLSDANTYTGSTTIGVSTTATAITLNVSSINSVATNATLGTVHSSSSDLGAPTSVANGTIFFTKNCILNYTGSGETTDRVINLDGSTTGGEINQSGSTGTLEFVSNMTSTTSSGTKTLALGGGGGGAGVFAGVISDDTTTKAATVFQTGLSKLGSTTWTVSGANTFTGPVSVGGTGQLILGSSSVSGTATGSTTSGPLGATFTINSLTTSTSNNVTSNGTTTTTATYTKSGSGNTQGANIVAGDTIVDPGVLPADTYVISAANSSGNYTLTLSSGALTSTTSNVTAASPIQMAASTETLNLNGQALLGQRIYMQNGANLSNFSATTAVINTDIADQNGATPDTTNADTYVVGGGTGNMSIAGINGGTMNHNGSGTLTITPGSGTTNVVNLLGTAGVIQMGQANALTNTSTLTLNGGTYGTGGFNQGLTSLTLNSINGTIDFGAGNTGSVLNFGSLASFAGTALTIDDWIGTAGQGGGTDQLLFANAANLTPAVLADIDFTGYNPGSELVTNGSETEVVPMAVPEPTSLAAVGLAMSALLVRRRRGATIVA